METGKVTLRTEVVGLNIELRSYDDRFPKLALTFNGETLFIKEIFQLSYDELAGKFCLKDKPGCNFFDHVMEVVDRSLEEHKRLVHPV